MGHRDCLIGWALVAGQALAGRLSERHYRSLPLLPRTPAHDAGHVSIVIPARNEASRLPRLLASLAELRYPAHDVTVVDDASTDDTAAVALAHGVRVIEVDGPEPGWIGKSYACWTGAGATNGDWILFTDADTVHGADSLGLALRFALAEGADLVSLLARQQCRTFPERLLLPYAYALYFVGARSLNGPGGNPVANGQYMLFRREGYERIGGHEAVRGSIIEDVSLARLAVARGARVVLARAEDHLEVRMYTGLRSLWEGFSKNAFCFVLVSPRTGIPTVLAGMAYGAALPAAWRQQSLLLRAALVLVPAVSLARWEQRFGVRVGYALLFPLAAAVFQTIALDSIRRSFLGGGTTWKGRRY